MAPNPEGHANVHGLTPREVNSLVSALLAMDLDQLPEPNYELMSRVYNNWKWPSRNACSELSRVKGKMKKIQARHKTTHSAKPGNMSKVTKKTDAKFEATKDTGKNFATENFASEEDYEEDSQTRNHDDIVEDIMDDIVDEVVRIFEDAQVAEGLQAGKDGKDGA
ncbi:hypothetical protein VMCG_00143 [Cytospora schulzeri]|uniref:Uncharacterized protein n=1 Tax=Cytospora schulzeri TaxID=448051 RepID=A0A423X9D2_9PEZI|nr:hypothetical protein VMCG_00143 [Valsa malicola]